MVSNDNEIAVVIDASTHVSSLIGAMKNKGVHDAVVTQNGDVIGLFSHLSLMGSRKDAANIPAGKYVKSIAKITKESTYADIAEQMIDPEIRVMPILNDDGTIDRIMGIREVVDQVVNTESKKPLKGGSRISMDYNGKLGEAMNLMKEKKLREIPVIEKGELAGYASSVRILETYSLYDTPTRAHGQVPNTPAETTQTELHDTKEAPIFNFINGDILIVPNASIGSIAAAMVQNDAPIVASRADDGILEFYYACDILRHALGEGEKAAITFPGIDGLGIEYNERRRINEIAESFAAKIQNLLNEEYEMIINLKEHSREGNRKRYEAICRLTYPGAVVTSRSEEWDVVAALRNSLESIESQISDR
jgi:CBS domain-containing protein